MLTVTNLTKTFRSGAGDVRAVNDVSFSVPDGTFAAIVGKSGSGKTTLLSLLGGLDTPSAGTIAVDDQSIGTLSSGALVRYRRSAVGFIFQHYNLVPNLTALENVMLPMEFAGVRGRDRAARAAQLLEQVGLDAGKQSRKPGRLSGGEQQRVSIARALANRPKLILADEPTGNLDSATGMMIDNLLKSIAKANDTTILVVTHDLELAKRADMTFHLSDGALDEGKAPLSHSVPEA